MTEIKTGANKTMNKYLVTAGQGLGNQIETIPLIEWLIQHDIDIDVCYCHRPKIDGDPGKSKVLEMYCDKRNIPFEISDNGKVEFPEHYEGQLVGCWTAPRKGVYICAQANRSYTNEIMANMDILRQMKLTDNVTDCLAEVMPLEWECGVGHDIVLCNGGFNTDKWRRKKYPHFEQLAEMLHILGYSVVSVGRKDEYIPGTVDKTEIGMVETAEIIANSRMGIFTDSGWYHWKGLIGGKGIALFTATNVKKNYHPLAYPEITVMQKGLKCQPCQSETWECTEMWHRCTQWRCQDIEPKKIVKNVQKILKIT